MRRRLAILNGLRRQVSAGSTAAFDNLSGSKGIPGTMAVRQVGLPGMLPASYNLGMQIGRVFEVTGRAATSIDSDNQDAEWFAGDSQWATDRIKNRSTPVRRSFRWAERKHDREPTALQSARGAIVNRSVLAAGTCCQTPARTPRMALLSVSS
jgi:hypothetical protein